MCSVKMRQKVEREIVTKVIECLLAAGFLIQVNDGEEDVTDRIKDSEAILAAMFSTDEDLLFVSIPDNDGVASRWIHFIYGNDGYDVIHDYTVNLEAVIKPAVELAESYS
jgi:hypothetical protein